LKITVLGKSPSWQDAGGACSGYLVEEEGLCVLLDCGSGVFSKLRCFRDYVDVDAVVISHLHADHILDLVPYACALTYAPRQQPVPVDRWPGTDTPARPRLLAPPGARDVLGRVAAACGHAEELVEKAFAVCEYEAEEELELGPVAFRFQKVPHFIPTQAVEFRALGSGRRFTFGADSGPTDELVAFARDTDLLMVEATLPRPERDGPRGHLTPAEAGEHGRRSQARELVLTHISDELDHTWAREEAERTFGAAVSVAAEGAVYEV